MEDLSIFFDPIYEEHLTGYGHPERPERLPVALESLSESGLLDKFPLRSPRDATVAEIGLKAVEKGRAVAITHPLDRAWIEAGRLAPRRLGFVPAPRPALVGARRRQGPALA